MTDARVNESNRELIPAARLRCSEHHSFMFTSTAFSSSEMSPHHPPSKGCCLGVIKYLKYPQITKKKKKSKPSTLSVTSILWKSMF